MKPAAAQLPAAQPAASNLGKRAREEEASPAKSGDAPHSPAIPGAAVKDEGTDDGSYESEYSSGEEGEYFPSNDDGGNDVDEVASGVVVKEEAFAESTDDEGDKHPALPSPVASGPVVKVKEEVFDESTDDEGDRELALPSPIASSCPVVKVKEEVGESTDDDDDNGNYSGEKWRKMYKELISLFEEHGHTNMDIHRGVHCSEALYQWALVQVGDIDRLSDMQIKKLHLLDLFDVSPKKYERCKSTIDLRRGRECLKGCNKFAAFDGYCSYHSGNDDNSDDEESEYTPSREESENENDLQGFENERLYVWCGNHNKLDAKYDKLLLLPYNRYRFWRNLRKCKTWGEIRALCQGDIDEEGYNFYAELIDRYKTRWEGVDGKQEDPTDETEVDLGPEGDFDLSNHNRYGDMTACGTFPPPIEEIMEKELKGAQHEWIHNYGKWEETWYEPWFVIDYEKKDAILKKIKELGGTARKCWDLRRFISAYTDY